MVRCWAVVAVVGLLGCESMKNPAPQNAPSPALSASRTSATSPPRGEVGVADHPASVQQIAIHPTSPRGGEVAEVREADKAGEGGVSQVQHIATEPEADHLTLVADCLERGDRAKAAVHLEAYVRLHPEQIMFRAQLAELFVRLGRDDAAKIHFERFAIDARNATGAPKDHLVHVHTRLMEIGQRSGDSFAEVFHRGVGLLLLVKEEDGKADRDADFCEEMLCKAMKSLAEAKELSPGEAQVRVYLAEVYDRMGNRRAADAERTAARAAAVPAGLGLSLRD